MCPVPCTSGYVLVGFPISVSRNIPENGTRHFLFSHVSLDQNPYSGTGLSLQVSSFGSFCWVFNHMLLLDQLICNQTPSHVSLRVSYFILLFLVTPDCLIKFELLIGLKISRLGYRSPIWAPISQSKTGPWDLPAQSWYRLSLDVCLSVYTRDRVLKSRIQPPTHNIPWCELFNVIQLLILYSIRCSLLFCYFSIYIYYF